MNSTDKQNNLEILSLWILPIVTTLVKYKINANQLTMIVVCGSKCICLLSHRLIVAGTGTPLSHSFPIAHKNQSVPYLSLNVICLLIYKLKQPPLVVHYVWFNLTS